MIRHVHWDIRVRRNLQDWEAAKFQGLVEMLVRTYESGMWDEMVRF